MLTRSIKILSLFAAISLLAACVPTLGQPLPTVDPDALNTLIAETANAALTQTAAAQPTSTFTPTITPTRPTDTPLPSFTPTVVFVLSTPTNTVTVTPTRTATPLAGGVGRNTPGPTSSVSYACQVISVNPANGTAFDSRADFDVFWRVRNTGQQTWDRNSIDFIYDSGDEIHKVEGYDLAANVRSGETVNLGVDVRAPRDPGSYSTTWTLRVGNQEFCKMTFTMRVR